MGTPIWQASGTSPVDIQINLDQAAQGWFTLAAIDADNGTTDLRRIDSQDADGDAFFRVTPNLDLMFKLQVLCASSAPAPGAGVWLCVQQGGATLPCCDATGQVINQNGGSYQAVQLGSVIQGQNQTFNFDVWP